MLTAPRTVAAALVLAATSGVASGQSQGDPRVRAFSEAYRSLIDSVTYRDRDAVFVIRGHAIHFADGRFLEEGRLDRRDSCDPIFYRYPLGPFTDPTAPAEEFPTTCRDAVESLWGSTEAEVRRNSSTIVFLEHRMFVHDALGGPLAAVERDLVDAASRNVAVAEWIAGIDITYSYINRDIASSDTPSYHAFGLAFDLVPISYQGRAVYWRWSRALDREGWQSIPLEGRWSPPHAVIEIFERYGFVWGGKWGYFDNIHFEYRPEIILYNRMLEGR